MSPDCSSKVIFDKHRLLQWEKQQHWITSKIKWKNQRLLTPQSKPFIVCGVAHWKKQQQQQFPRTCVLQKKQWCHEPASMLGLTFPHCKIQKKCPSQKRIPRKMVNWTHDTKEKKSLVGLSEFVLLNTGSRTSCRREFSCILLTINSQYLKPVNAVFNWWKLFCVER